MPWGAIAIGLIALLLIGAIAVAILNVSGLTKADTFPSILAYGLSFLALCLIATNLTCRICRAQVGRLDRG